MKLTTKERLELFVPICQAVQHAHQKGLVHRDLKPANILVTMIDGKPVPKVIDFGVAKATAGKLIDEPMSTQFGSVVGTLEYMSPEQAGFSGEDIDTRADIYSLGVILYELLTGLRPIDANRLKKAALTEMIRIIREEEPAKPSTRLSTDDSLPSVAALRHTEPRKLMALLRGELDWVVMKCLEKHRERRYETANGLARDIQRYLADEAVEARPPSAGYRFGKFVRRHKGQVIAASLVLLTLLGGLGAVAAVQAVANARLAASLSRETNANKALAAANEELTQSRVVVQARYDLAVEAIKTFHTGVSEDFLLKEDQFKDLRDRLLKSASDFYGKLGVLLGKESDVGSRRALALSNFELAELTRLVGGPEAALAAHRAVLAAREMLAAEPGADAGAKADVGRSLTAIGRLLEAAGRTDEALASYRRSESLLASLWSFDPAARAALAACRFRMGYLMSGTGKTDEALAVCELARADQEALAAAPGASNDERYELANTVLLMGGLVRPTGKLTEAEVEIRTALATFQKLAHENPAVTKFRFSLASSHYTLGDLLGVKGRFSEAEAELRTSLAIRQRLAEENPVVTRHRLALAFDHNRLGMLLSTTGRPSKAEAEYRTAVAICQKLAQDHPAVTACRSELAMSQMVLGLLLLQTGKPLAAEAQCRTAPAISQKLADDNPTYTEFPDYFTWTCSALGDVLRSLGRTSEAKGCYERAITLAEPQVAKDPRNMRNRSVLACVIWRRGLTLGELGSTAGASADVRRALALCDGLPPWSGYEYETACCHATLAGLAGRAGSGVSVAEGQIEAVRAMEWLDRAVAMGYRNANELRIESALDSLRSHDDFRLLMMDLLFPTEPFTE